MQVLKGGFLQRDASVRALSSDRRNFFHNVSQKFKRLAAQCEIPPHRTMPFRDLISGRAKGDGPKVTEPNLRLPAVVSENLRGFLRFPAHSKCLNFQEKG